MIQKRTVVDGIVPIRRRASVFVNDVPGVQAVDRFVVMKSLVTQVREPGRERKEDQEYDPENQKRSGTVRLGIHFRQKGVAQLFRLR
jgi:hypothetical protein